MACASRSRGKRAGKSGKIAPARERNGAATETRVNETKVRVFIYLFISAQVPKPPIDHDHDRGSFRDRIYVIARSLIASRQIRYPRTEQNPRQNFTNSSRMLSLASLSAKRVPMDSAVLSI